MFGAAGHGWCTILGRARLEGPLSQLFPWKTEPRPIYPKRTGDLPHGRGCLPWRWQVPTTIPQWRVQVWVNVPNHVQSCRPWMMHHPGQVKAGRTLVSALPLKNWTQTDLPKTHSGTFPMVEAASPEDSKSLPPFLQGAVQVWVNVPNHVWSCWMCTTLMNLGELGCSAPWLKFPWKLSLGHSAWNSQGTCPQPRTIFPEDGKSLALSSKEHARHK